MKKPEPRRVSPTGEITTPRLVIGLIDGVGRDLRRRYMPDTAGPEGAEAEPAPIAPIAPAETGADDRAGEASPASRP